MEVFSSNAAGWRPPLHVCVRRRVHQNEVPVLHDSEEGFFSLPLFFPFVPSAVKHTAAGNKHHVINHQTKRGAPSARNGMGLAGRNEKSYQLLTHLLALLAWQRGLQSPGLTKHSRAGSSLSEKLHREEDEHKASVFSSFFFFENPFKVATCVYLAAPPCHCYTSTLDPNGSFPTLQAL